MSSVSSPIDLLDCLAFLALGLSTGPSRAEARRSEILGAACSRSSITRGGPLQNPFETALRQGLTMEAVSLTKQPDADDDLLEIRFGLADPAISKLKAG